MTILGIILVTDRTHLTNFTGDKKMHAIYISLRNISKEIQKRWNAQAWLLLAKVPVSKFPKTVFPGSKTEQGVMPGILGQCLFHRCMKIVLTPLRIDQRKYYIVPSPDGNSRQCMVILMGWIADLEEQLLIAGVKTFSCPVCCAGYDNLPQPGCFGVRTGDLITSVLKEIHEKFPLASAYEFKQEVRKLGLGLSGSFKDPCWEGLGVDLSVFIKQDILHRIHKFIWDHPGTWLRHLLRDQEMDHRFIAQPPLHFQHFGSGISKTSQASGQEHRTYQRLILPVIASHEKVDNKVIKTIWSILDYTYMVQYPVLSEIDLQKMASLLIVFHQNQEIFISNGLQNSDHLCIPKLHAL